MVIGPNVRKVAQGTLLPPEYNRCGATFRALIRARRYGLGALTE